MNTQSVWARAASCLEAVGGGLCLTLAAASVLMAVDAHAAEASAQTATLAAPPVAGSPH